MEAKTGLLIFVVLLSLTFFSQGSLAADEPSEAYSLEMGVVYSTIADQALTLNIAIPTVGKGPFPCVVYLPWSGVASYDTLSAIKATERGYVGITVDFRRESLFPILMCDVRNALSWITLNAGQYNIDASSVALVGYSFGAYVAALVGYVGEGDFLIGSCDPPIRYPSIRAIVSISGIADWRMVKGEFGLHLLGGTYEDNMAAYEAASPLSYIDKDSPPTLLLHGELDNTIPPVNSEMLAHKLSEQGVTCIFLLLENESHYIGNRVDSEPVWEFLEEHLVHTP